MTCRIHEGNALDVLPTLPEASAHCLVTSPPYYALRRYEGVEPSRWPAVSYSPMPGLPPLDVPAMTCTLGNESTPEAYIAHLVLIFRAAWKVLRPEASAWINLADSYASGQSAKPSNAGFNERYGNAPGARVQEKAASLAKAVPAGVKPKDLLLIPSRFALAMQADGWFVRQVISWQKVAPMPQSCRDRPTTATEEIFLLAKQGRYFYDREACLVPNAESSGGWQTRFVNGEPIGGDRYDLQSLSDVVERNPNGRNLWNWFDVGEDEESAMPPKLRWLLAAEPQTRGKGKRHYAAFPGLIPWRAIKLATSAKGCCPRCGAPHARVTLKLSQAGRYSEPGYSKLGDQRNDTDRRGPGTSFSNNPDARTPSHVETLGWHQTCACPDAPPAPCVVLDCFAGTATVGVVARALGRDFVGVEASGVYASLARERVAAVAPLLDHEDARPAPEQPGLFTQEDA